MKKRILIICIIVAILGGVVYLFFNKNKTKDTDVQSTNASDYYGKRGNITETERVSFLIKGEDLLVRNDGTRT